MRTEVKITEYGKWNDRLEMLAYEMIALISKGETEDVDCIISHFESKDVVHYLMNKYKKDMFYINESCPYNLDDWEIVLGEYSYMTYSHDVRRKMGLLNKEKDGLLLLVGIILGEVSNRRYS